MERDIVVRVNAIYWSKELLTTYWYLVALMLALVSGVLWLKARQSPVGRRTTTIGSSHLSLTMAHVLFMDVVEYSKLPMDEGTLLIQQLQDVVRSTSAFQRADKNQELIKLPTGDGMALVFLGHDPQDAAFCATELSRCLRLRDDIQLRMGLHTGPVYRVADINANANVAGGGINIAERVMSCGDSGHILVSKTMAEVLTQLSTWAPSLHDLGELEVKHRVRVQMFNLCSSEFGNRELPQKASKAALASAQ